MVIFLGYVSIPEGIVFLGVMFDDDDDWLVVWNMNFMTFHILGIMIPTDFHIFQRGWNHQPDTVVKNIWHQLTTVKNRLKTVKQQLKQQVNNR